MVTVSATTPYHQIGGTHAFNTVRFGASTSAVCAGRSRGRHGRGVRAVGLACCGTGCRARPARGVQAGAAWVCWRSGAGGAPAGRADRSERARGGRDAVAVSWQALASGSAPAGYIVTADPDCGGKKRTKRVSADTTSVTFNKLRRCDIYRLSVRAKNAAGKGDKAELIWQRPQPQNNELAYQGGASTVEVVDASVTWSDLGYARGCSGATQCSTAVGGDPVLSGHSPLKITGIYAVTADHLPSGALTQPVLFTIVLSGDWPDTTDWTASLTDFHDPLPFNDANVHGRYAVWTSLSANSAFQFLSTLEIHKPA
ncbi:fibronectin type III domain-containing protein [Candidatus Poriferisodalis sp.]|uniref:fibronectin type III domain-containing protein n=1 Tax=Candidatus Poriferisodalis sp. TaxID=3101277 RepID=UPI003B02AB8D